MQHLDGDTHHCAIAPGRPFSVQQKAAHRGPQKAGQNRCRRAGRPGKLSRAPKRRKPALDAADDARDDARRPAKKKPGAKRRRIPHIDGCAADINAKFCEKHRKAAKTYADCDLPDRIRQSAEGAPLVQQRNAGGQNAREQDAEEQA